MSVGNMPIGEIGLPVRATNALRRKGIHTVGAMLEQTEESLYMIRNLGTKSIVLILEKINEYAALAKEEEKTAAKDGLNIDFGQWIGDEDNRMTVLEFLRKEKCRIDDLELLSPRAYNLLMLADTESLDALAFRTEEQLMTVPMMNPSSAAEIEKQVSSYIASRAAEILAFAAENAKAEECAAVPDVFTAVIMPEYRAAILEYARTNDVDLSLTGLSARAKNQLAKNGFHRVSEIVLMTGKELMGIPAMGGLTVGEIESFIREYLGKNEKRILAYLQGDTDSLWDDDAVRRRILGLYHGNWFRGFSLDEFEEALDLPETFSAARLKGVIGGLLAEGKLEYVDYRCFRVYDSFRDYYPDCPAVDDRAKDMIGKRLKDVTLDKLGKEYGLTRERVRQIIGKAVVKIRQSHAEGNSALPFDEDYYGYLYGTYEFDREDGAKWFGVPEYVWNYLDMEGIKRGKKDLESALQDRDGLDAGLRMRIRNYLNRNLLFVDGRWVEKKRSALEEVVVRRFCTDSVSFDDYYRFYNLFLQQEEIEYDETVYYTDEVYRTRKNRLADARFLLWKQNEMIRYYDIDGRDYTELLEELALDSYEDTEVSTLKFVREHPELMRRYDIRDQYELHNLLRKIVPEGSYHDFHCGRMPNLRFGTFDREAAIREILVENSPIRMNELVELIENEYGYDCNLIAASYLSPFKKYLHRGVYTVDFKEMPSERKSRLLQELKDDFYYIDEIRQTFRSLFPEADMEELDPRNLKAMGFVVYSGYAIQHYDSADEFYQDLLTREDVYDAAPIRRRYGKTTFFHQKFINLRRDLQIIEFEPNQMIHIRKLEQQGISKEDLTAFCDRVCEYVGGETWFTMKSIRKSGFDSSLFSLGFSDWFYANLLIADSRFSYCQMLGNLVFFKGKLDMSIKGFLTELLRERGSVDIHELMSELYDEYGCAVHDKSDLTSKIANSEIYYDEILERLYGNRNLFYREIEEGEY